MHFYYLDEAGCTGADLGNMQQPIFVLGGVSVRDEGWNASQQALAQIFANYFEENIPQGFELHTEELLSPNGNGPFEGHDRQRRNQLALDILALLAIRSHDVHLYAIDKAKLAAILDMPVGVERMPYMLAYDYLLTYVNWFVKEKLGRSARGMLIIDAKDGFYAAIERITAERRFEGVLAHRIKWIVEFTYPVDSRKNPMVQLSDLVVYCTKKFFEIDGGYRDSYLDETKQFFAQCYALIHDRIAHKTLINRDGRGMDGLNNLLANIQASPQGRWRQRYGI